MRVRVLRPHMGDGGKIVEAGEILKVSLLRAKDLEQRKLAIPTFDQGAVNKLVEVADKKTSPLYETAPAWWPDWRGEPCIIVASGPSAADVDLSAARGKARIITINTSWKLAPWADVLYACDFAWWKFNNGARGFQGMKISQDADTPRHFPEIKRVESRRDRDDILLTEPGVIGWGGNGGFQALNLAAQFLPSKIVLVGYDMRIDLGMHWHGPHPNGQNNPMAKNIERWRRAIDGASETFEALGIPVVNCSKISALKNYPRVTFEDAIGC